MVINKPVFKALNEYLKAAHADENDFLFPNRKGNGPLQSQAVQKLIKKWTSAIDLKGN